MELDTLKNMQSELKEEKKKWHSEKETIEQTKKILVDQRV